MKTTAAVMLCILILLSAAVNAAEYEFGAGYKISLMDWKEFNPYSVRKPQTEESGLVHFVNGNLLAKLTEKIFLKSELEIFLSNRIKYKGELIQDGTPYNTTGFWQGLRLEETIEYKIKIKDNFSLIPFASVGFSVWQRSVAAETWHTLYGNLGVKIEKGIFFAKLRTSCLCTRRLMGTGKMSPG